jgi:glycosyltransferase involved in cell wall biosynthesis
MSELITVGYSTRKHNPEFIEYLKKSSGFKKINVIEKVNNGEKSLSQVYNEILEESQTDIVVLCHDDIYFDTASWYSKIVKHFEKSDFGILGVAGTTSLTDSGRWWDKKRKMVGIVNHEHEGKKWESRYSESFENGICETLIVDGLFIALHKKRIKKNFDESVNGFHFYDVTFSFSNHLEGVKIGVITNIRITHKSIGMTNEKWDENRIIFADKFKENLPIRLPFNEDRKLKVLLSCLFFRTFTGSELYVYELAKNLVKLNCDVTVLSEIGGPLTDMAKKDGIKVVPFSEPPGYKMGDGKWSLNTPQGIQQSQPNVLYRVSEVNFDIVHVQHKPVAERIFQMYPEIDKIYTIHSEVIEVENPVKNDTVKKYIAIRPEIKEYIKKFDIDEKDIEIIYNPVDNTKFNNNNIKTENYTLFVGTIDYLREKTILDLIEYTKLNSQELWLVGENKSNYLNSILENSHVKYFPPTWNVEKYIKNCKETAGIQLGRTTIEGWMCGKSGWIYNVDFNGDILDKNKTQPPTDIEKYYSSNVAEKIKKEYIKILS